MCEKADFECTICGYEWAAKASNILHLSIGCPRCAGNIGLSEEKFWELIGNNYPSYQVTGDYINTASPMFCECLVCGHSWATRAENLIYHTTGCRKCADKLHGESLRLTNKEFLDRIDDTVEPLEEFIKFGTRMKCLCKICGNIWETSPDSLINGTRCPLCGSNSKGEDIVDKYLKRFQISYFRAHKFKDLTGTGGRQLSYDFYLPTYNLLIEVQGDQHRRPIEHFGGETQFKIQQEHDKRKREYAEAHGIELLEIWTEDFDRIPEILSQKLNLKLESVTTTGAA